MKTIAMLCYIIIMWMLVTAYNGQVPQQNHRCGHCGRSFTTGKALGCHRKSHISSSAAFKCEFCHTQFTRGDNLARHQKRVHPVQIGGALGEIPRVGTTSMSRLEALARPSVRAALNHACKVSAVVLVNLLSFFFTYVLGFLGAFMDR